jgi:anthranilate phosphoribosyltransferase
MTIKDAIAAALRREDLSADAMAAVFGEIMDGRATPAQIGGLLVALRAKGETVDELIGAATAMRTRAQPLPCEVHRAVDTCGTGGDGVGTINVSTLAALILAGCGAVVAKHGNRAQSSRCGSADVLEALGVAVDATPATVARCLATAGIGFAFAPAFHAATRHAAGPRKELGTRTIFNLLGPLTNPARVAHQVVGVFDAQWCEPVARALGGLGVRRAAVVHGAGHVDELAVRGDSFVAVWDGAASVRTLSPRGFGLEDCDPAGLDGGDPSFNAAVLRRVLAGFDTAPGEPLRAVHNAAVMTAALALELMEARPLDWDALPAQAARASAALAGHEAALALDRLVKASREAT